MKSFLAIYFPSSAQTGTEQVLREVIAGAYAEAALCKCPFYIQQVRDMAEVSGSLGLMGMFSASIRKSDYLKLGIPLVNVSNYSGPVAGMANVLSDDATVGRMAAEHLLAKGYRHFLAVGQAGPRWSLDRLGGFIHAVQAGGHPVQAVDLDPADLRSGFAPSAYLQRIWEQISPLLRDAPLATGIFAANDWLAWPILQLFREKTPERLHTTALLGVDNLHDQLFDPSRTAGLSSIQPGFRKMGARGLRLLIDAARDGREIDGALEHVPPAKLHTRGSTAGTACEDPVVSNVVRELWAALQAGEDLSIRDLARRHGMSLRNMELRFEAQLGLSARMLVADMRVQYGQELLRDTDAPIGEVSERCGYANSTTFSTSFGKKTGFTPKEWRIKHRTVPSD